MNLNLHHLMELSAATAIHPAARQRSRPSLRQRCWPKPAVALFAILAWLLPCLAMAQHSVTLERADLVNQADAIAVASLLSAQPRWNSRRNVIVTDYRFRIESTPLPGSLGNYEFVVTQGGGTIEGVTHELSSNPRLQTGTRYLVFLNPERAEIFSPFVGNDQGIYRIDASDTAHALSGQDRRPLAELLAEVEALVVARGSNSPALVRPQRQDGVVYPSKTYEPSLLSTQVPGFPPREADPVAGPEPRIALADPTRDPEGVQRKSAPTPNWHVTNRANRPIVWDQWPQEWWTSSIDEHMMAYWNRYADNLNRISGAQLTTWAWGNGRFEMVGFPSNADMVAQFGEGWGTNTLAVCWRRFSGGIVQEADIAVNPAYSWSLDTRLAAEPTSASWNLRQTVLHELGHGWGLDHPWEFENVWWDSTMNYTPKEWRLPILHEDDTDSVRVTFPGGATINNDGLVSLYRTADNSTSTHPTYTAAFPNSVTLRHGGTLNIGGVQIENPGLTTISSPQLSIYLNQNWRSFTDTYVLLRTASFLSTIAPSTTSYQTISATTISPIIPVGIYYPTVWLPITGDQYTDNNFGIADPTRRVTIANNPVTLSPTTAWQTWSIGRVGPLGLWDLYLPVVAGRTYELSLCPAIGNGSATFDTVLEVVGSISNDDYCGLGSRLLYVAPTSGTRTIRVRGFDIASQGTFTLAYRQLVTDRIYAHGFDSTN